MLVLSLLGSTRVLDMLGGEQLPRIRQASMHVYPNVFMRSSLDVARDDPERAEGSGHLAPSEQNRALEGGCNRESKC